MQIGLTGNYLQLKKTLFLHTKTKTFMKLKLFVLLLVALIPQLSFAQGAALTIFSEDGDKFILYLNGVQQNNAPQTNLRLDGLSQPYYKARIVFEDKAKGQIDKSIPVNDPQTNQPADVVYRIKNKDGDMKLRYYSAQPIQPNYTPPADVYVVHYGQPDPGPATTVTQTTVTTTTNNNPNMGGSVNINAGGGNGGVGISINVSDPNMGGASQTTQTTTTTTSYSTTSTSSGYATSQPAPASTGCQYPMAFNDFSSAKQTVKNASFDETKLSTAKSILASNCFNTDQVIEICKMFGFEQTKLDFAKYAYARTTDPGNYFKVGNIFSFDASKNELNEFISNGGR